MMPTISIETPCIIIAAKTGVKYFNQTGGYAVHDLEVEGYIIPLPEKYYSRVKDGEQSNSDNPYWNSYNLQAHFDHLFAPIETDPPSKFSTKYNGHCYNGIDEEDAQYIEKAFGESHSGILGIQVCRDKLKDCEEARIFVTIKYRQFSPQGDEGIMEVEGILTWENSD